MHEMAKKATLSIVNKDVQTPDKRAFTEAFAERLVRAIDDTRYGKADIARVCGVKRDTVRQWMDGRAVVPAVYWAPICEMLYIDVWQLLTGRPRGPIPPMPASVRNPNPKPAAKRA